MQQMNKNMEPIGEYTLIGANIVNTGVISYNLGDTGSIAKVDAVLSYHYWVPGNNGSSGQYQGVMAKDQAYATPGLGAGVLTTWQ